jgi:transposase
MLYVGLDIHSKHIALCVLNQTGQVVQRARVRGLEEMLRLLKGLPDRF